MTRKITFFLDSLPVGGAERHAMKLAAALKTRGFDVSFLIYSGIRSASYLDSDLPDHTEVLGRASNNTDFAGWRMAGEAIDKFKPDVLVAVNQATLAVSVISKLMGIHRAPIVCSFHTTIIDTLRGKIRLPLFYGLLRFADSIIYVSENQKRYWESRGLKAGASAAIVNGVDSQFYSPPSDAERRQARERLGFLDDDYVVGITAQFRPEKNHGQLLDAVAVLVKRGVPAKVLFVGEGEQRPVVEAKAQALGLRDQVRFVGEQRDVRPFLAAMDVGVLTSTSVETLSLAALEAMASAVPVVMSNIGGASEIITDGVNGYLFPAGDTAALVERLEKLMSPTERSPMRAAARRIASEKFAYKRMADAYAAYFERFGSEEVVAARRASA
ncbi:glycosyltransferase family 4 protein [Caulobacter sp. 17J65-9]|uniref:glycosyltransferase family 4 protein n=1 Tax=Caulobacter sp. 17J65-9 TaxID=2709382 RepID=UPI0013C77E86|nr:glycosyltransferase family 4 protein [Caulobacter sp. 17J65-9]NEX94402.1 glycosyltransferase family 4 protein [Caulobacter sp. 17J65-9]